MQAPACNAVHIANISLLMKQLDSQRKAYLKPCFGHGPQPLTVIRSHSQESFKVLQRPPATHSQPAHGHASSRRALAEGVRNPEVLKPLCLEKELLLFPPFVPPTPPPPPYPQSIFQTLGPSRSGLPSPTATAAPGAAAGRACRGRSSRRCT